MTLNCYCYFNSTVAVQVRAVSHMWLWAMAACLLRPSLQSLAFSGTDCSSLLWIPIRSTFSESCKLRLVLEQELTLKSSSSSICGNFSHSWLDRNSSCTFSLCKDSCTCAWDHLGCESHTTFPRESHTPSCGLSQVTLPTVSGPWLSASAHLPHCLYSPFFGSH